MTELSSVLDTVTVFPDRARVTRRGRVTLEPGTHKLEISGLPLSLLPDSVRASGKGTAKARLLGVGVQITHTVDTPAEAARELEEKILALTDADADLAAQAGLLGKAQVSLDGLAAQNEVFARGLALRNRSTADQGALYDFIAERGRTIQAETLAIARKRRDLAKELDLRRRELAQIQSARPRQRTTATVEVEVTAAGDLAVELTYVVQPAGWQPLYDLRLTAGGLALTYLAEVTQSTGEDWTGVSLTLSTARPALALVIPELDPWYLAPRPPLRAKTLSAPMAPMAPMATAAVAAGGRAFEPQAQELMAVEEMSLELPEATVAESGAALTYQIPGRADVPSNGETRKVTVSSFNLRPDFDNVTAPKLEPVVYRRARAKNDSPYTLLPGPAQLFENDDYLGATDLKLAAPGQEIELALGADERIRIERKLIARDVDKTFLADRRRIRSKHSIELENLRDTPQVVLVRDQLPVSRHEQIKVKLESAEPALTKHTPLNQLEWKINLDPGARRTLHFESSVELPRGMDVMGLE